MSTTSMAIFSNPLFATYTVYDARNASIIHLLSLQQSKVCTSQIKKKNNYNNFVHRIKETLSLFLSLLTRWLNGHFPGGLGLASIRMSVSFWISLELRMMEMVVTSGAIRRAKLQSNCHHQQTNIQFFLQAGCPSCHPINRVRALNRRQDFKNW